MKIKVAYIGSTEQLRMFGNKLFTEAQVKEIRNV